MAQLKMYWLPGTEIKEYEFPEGYSVSNYKTDSDKLAWCECCKNGLVGDDADESTFYDRIERNSNINIYEDVFFLDYKGEHVGTVTAFVNKEDNTGDMHMVGIKTDFRGKGLSKYLNMITLKWLSKKDIKYISLTTDEWRKGAVKSYLSGGFLPVEYAYGMQDRWEKVLEEYSIESVQMLYEDATPFRIIHRRSKAEKIKIGVLGTGRGQTMMDYCKDSGSAELVAICDNYKTALENAKQKYGDGITYYSDFDEFLKHDMDCVVLANFANEHAPYAIKCLKAGKNVLSEVLPVQTMKQAVELIETIEETGLVYAYAENYCFMPAPKKMKELYEEGVLGSFEYGEGEYVHNCEPGWRRYTRADKNHWRNTMSAFYYCTHSIGPLLHITGMRPVKVTGFELPFNQRMFRMGAKAGPLGIEMITLENGAIIKSIHGVGPSKNSIWYSIYGSKGRMESSREDENAGAVEKLMVNCDENDGDNKSEPIVVDTKDAVSELADGSGHGGSDYYIMHNLVQKLRGNRNADTVDIYEALDMFLPGMFAYRSVLNGGIPMDIPNLRDPKEREKWRNDTQCTDPNVAGDQLIPSYSKGNPEIPEENYEFLATLPSDDYNVDLQKKLISEGKRAKL